MPMYLTLGETAQKFDVSKGTITHWAQRGLLYAIQSDEMNKGKRKIVFTTQDVRFLEKVVHSLPQGRRRFRNVLFYFRKAVAEEYRRKFQNRIISQ